MAFTKIEPSDLIGKGVVGLPDSPGLTATQMQEKFDEIALDVIVPKFNNVCDELDTFEGDYNDEKTQLETQIASLKQDVANLQPNLIPFPYYDGTSKTINGITFTVDENGVVDANGTATGGDAGFMLSYNVPLTNGETYRLGVPTSDMTGSHFVQAFYDDWSNFYSNIPNDTIYNVPFVFDGSKSMHVRVTVLNGFTVNHMKFYPMLVKGTVSPTEYSSYRGGINVEEGNIIFPSGNADLVVCRRTGNTVFFSVRIQNMDVPYGSPLLKLPQDFAPSVFQTILLPCQMVIDGIEYTTSLFSIGTNGDVVQEKAMGRVTTLCLCGVYII